LRTTTCSRVEGKWELITSVDILAETAGVLTRPVFRKYLTVEESIEFVAAVGEAATFVADPTHLTQGSAAIPTTTSSWLSLNARRSTSSCPAIST